MLVLSPMQALVLAAIWRAGDAGTSIDRLVGVLEAHRDMRRLDPPKDPRLIVRVIVNQVNRALVRAGEPRIEDGRRGDRLYRIRFDANADIRKSVNLAFKIIRERKAAGGPGWGE